MTRRIVVAILASCACHSDAPPQAPVAKPPAMCDRVADHVVGLMSASQKAKSEELDPFRNVISKRCTEDHWSDEAQQCLNTIATLPEGDRCEHMLTEDQAKALERDGRAAADAASPGGGRSLADKPSEAAPPPAAAAPIAPAPTGGAPPPPPPPAKSLTKAKKAKSAPGANSDPCEGGE